MKKFFMNLFGIEATAQNIRGRKSDGIEDLHTFQHFKRRYQNKGGCGEDVN